MEYYKKITLKDGRECILRNGTGNDGAELLNVFVASHGETDYLLTYPEESAFTAEQEGTYLQNKADSENEIEILAAVDGKIVGTAGIEILGSKEKIRRRADFGISVLRAYWGLGIGRALTEACIECAQKAGYSQLELQAVAENESALSLYRSVGFTEYGRNPKGFRSRFTGWQELILMRLELDKDLV